MIFLFGAFSIQAQGDIEWSENIGIGETDYITRFIGHSKTHFYTNRFESHKEFIDAYSLKTMRLEKSVELASMVNGKKLTIINKLIYDDGIVLISTLYNRKTKSTFTYLQKLDGNSLMPSNPIQIGEKKVVKTKSLMSNLSFKMLAKMGYDVTPILSSDNNQFAYALEYIYSSEIINFGDGSYSYAINGIKGKLMDKDLTVLSENNFEIPYSNFIILGVKLSNTGIIYVVGDKIITDNKSNLILNSVGIVKKETLLLALDPETNDFEVVSIDIPEVEFKSVSLKIGLDGSVHLGGIMYDPSTELFGGYYSKYDADLVEVASNFVDFEKEFVTEHWSEKRLENLEKLNEKQEKKGKETIDPVSYNYQIKDLILNPNGTTTLLVEQFHIETVEHSSYTPNSGWQTYTTFNYYYKDVIVLNFDKNGDFLWKTVVTKYQSNTTTSRLPLSFCNITQGNNIHLLYNEQKVNSMDTKNMSDIEVTKFSSINVVKHVVIAADGKQSSENLYDFEKNGFGIDPLNCGQLDENRGILYTKSGRLSKIGLIKW